MKDLIIEKSKISPYVNFGNTTGVFRLEGRSIHENPDAFYRNIFKWVDKYFQNPAEKTLVVMKLEYANSGSSKFILELLRIIKKHYDAGNPCIVEWYYEEEDEAIYNLGLHYKESVQIPFDIKIVYE